jgi:Lon protease-like protein
VADDEHERAFPLFPLGLVAVPHELIPLHIFEARYRVMVADCLDRGGEFGIVWAADDELRETGCAVEVADVVERFDDGRLNIVVRGTRPFRLLDHDDHMGYPSGSVSWLDDEEETLDPLALDDAHTAYADLVRSATDRELTPADLEDMGAYRMAATVEFGAGAKQALLDLRSENARLRLLTRLFRAATKRLELIGRAEARARSNGKVRFG